MGSSKLWGPHKWTRRNRYSNHWATRDRFGLSFPAGYLGSHAAPLLEPRCTARRPYWRRTDPAAFLRARRPALVGGVGDQSRVGIQSISTQGSGIPCDLSLAVSELTTRFGLSLEAVRLKKVTGPESDQSRLEDDESTREYNPPKHLPFQLVIFDLRSCQRERVAGSLSQPIDSGYVWFRARGTHHRPC